MFGYAGSDMRTLGCQTRVTNLTILHPHDQSPRRTAANHPRKASFDWFGGGDHQDARFLRSERLTVSFSWAISPTFRNWREQARQERTPSRKLGTKLLQVHAALSALLRPQTFCNCSRRPSSRHQYQPVRGCPIDWCKKDPRIENAESALRDTNDPRRIICRASRGIRHDKSTQNMEPGGRETNVAQEGRKHQACIQCIGRKPQRKRLQAETLRRPHSIHLNRRV